jgi:hypothetical protein
MLYGFEKFSLGPKSSLEIRLAREIKADPALKVLKRALKRLQEVFCFVLFFDWLHRRWISHIRIRPPTRPTNAAHPASQQFQRLSRTSHHLHNEKHLNALSCSVLVHKSFLRSIGACRVNRSNWCGQNEQVSHIRRRCAGSERSDTS